MCANGGSLSLPQRQEIWDRADEIDGGRAGCRVTSVAVGAGRCTGARRHGHRQVEPWRAELVWGGAASSCSWQAAPARQGKMWGMRPSAIEGSVVTAVSLLPSGVLVISRLTGTGLGSGGLRCVKPKGMSLCERRCPALLGDKSSGGGCSEVEDGGERGADQRIAGESERAWWFMAAPARGSAVERLEARLRLRYAGSRSDGERRRYPDAEAEARSSAVARRGLENVRRGPYRVPAIWSRKRGFIGYWTRGCL